MLDANHIIDFSLDIDFSNAAGDDNDEVDEPDGLTDSQSDKYPEVDEAGEEGSEAAMDEEDEMAADQDELAEDAPVAPALGMFFSFLFLIGHEMLM